VMSALSVPLVSRDKLFGVLNVNASSDRRYTVYDLQAAFPLRRAGGGGHRERPAL
jgi:putative methionine-R-sulfoxide reductase with GAF domain